MFPFLVFNLHFWVHPMVPIHEMRFYPRSCSFNWVKKSLKIIKLYCRFFYNLIRLGNYRKYAGSHNKRPIIFSKLVQHMKTLFKIQFYAQNEYIMSKICKQTRRRTKKKELKNMSTVLPAGVHHPTKVVDTKYDSTAFCKEMQ